MFANLVFALVRIRIDKKNFWRLIMKVHVNDIGEDEFMQVELRPSGKSLYSSKELRYIQFTRLKGRGLVVRVSPIFWGNITEFRGCFLDNIHIACGEEIHMVLKDRDSTQTIHGTVESISIQRGMF